MRHVFRHLYFFFFGFEALKALADGAPLLPTRLIFSTGLPAAFWALILLRLA